MPFFAPIANGKIDDALASIRFCTTVADPPVNYSMYVPQRALYNYPIVVPDRPHARLMFCSLFAGWRCLCPVRHSHHLVFLHLREHRRICERSCSRRPSGVFTCFALRACRAVVSMSTCSREAQSQSSTAECIPTKLLAPMYVPATPAKSRPSALFHMFRACACRVAVSMSSTAQSRLGLP
jgi:hypothetical protein